MAREGTAGATRGPAEPPAVPQRPLPRLPSPATVNHHGHQVVHAVQVHGVAGRVEEPELQREDHPVGQLGVPVQLLHVLEPFQVQGQNHGQLLHSHPRGPRNRPSAVPHGRQGDTNPLPPPQRTAGGAHGRQSRKHADRSQEPEERACAEPAPPTLGEPGHSRPGRGATAGLGFSLGKGARPEFVPVKPRTCNCSP